MTNLSIKHIAICTSYQIESKYFLYFFFSIICTHLRPFIKMISDSIRQHLQNLKCNLFLNWGEVNIKIFLLKWFYSECIYENISIDFTYCKHLNILNWQKFNNKFGKTEYFFYLIFFYYENTWERNTHMTFFLTFFPIIINIYYYFDSDWGEFNKIHHDVKNKPGHNIWS